MHKMKKDCFWYHKAGCFFFVMIMVFGCVLLPVQKLLATGYDDSDENMTANLSYVNTATGYQAILTDEAKLLNAEEADSLLGKMQGVTDYGNVAFVSTDSNYDTAQAYAQSCYYELFGVDSGTLFLIDMDNRMLYIYSYGDMYKVLTKSYADTITDNVYTYATDGDYYTCCSKVFEQELALLSGQHIFQPMKYASNILLALLLAMLINYFIVRIFAAARKPSDEELMKGIFEQQHVSNIYPAFTHETKVYSPQSSGSSSGGGGGGGSSGGGGGGGGHSF